MRFSALFLIAALSLPLPTSAQKGFIGVDEALLLGLASIFYSISLAIIPFLAARIVRGETFGTIAHVILNKIPLIPRH